MEVRDGTEVRIQSIGRLVLYYTYSTYVVTTFLCIVEEALSLCSKGTLMYVQYQLASLHVYIIYNVYVISLLLPWQHIYMLRGYSSSSSTGDEGGCSKQAKARTP